MGKVRIEIQITSLLTVLIFGLFTFSCTKQNNPISSNFEVCGAVSSSERWQEFNVSNSCLPSNTIRCLEIDLIINLTEK